MDYIDIYVLLRRFNAIQQGNINQADILDSIDKNELQQDNNLIDDNKIVNNKSNQNNYDHESLKKQNIFINNIESP